MAAASFMVAVRVRGRFCGVVSPHSSVDNYPGRNNVPVCRRLPAQRLLDLRLEVLP